MTYGMQGYILWPPRKKFPLPLEFLWNSSLFFYGHIKHGKQNKDIFPLFNYYSPLFFSFLLFASLFSLSFPFFSFKRGGWVLAGIYISDGMRKVFLLFIYFLLLWNEICVTLYSFIKSLEKLRKEINVR